MKVVKEPNNPVDPRAIAFVCKLNQLKNGRELVVSEALNAVQTAMDQQKILEVKFSCMGETYCILERLWLVCWSSSSKVTGLGVLC